MWVRQLTLPTRLPGAPTNNPTAWDHSPEPSFRSRRSSILNLAVFSRMRPTCLQCCPCFSALVSSAAMPEESHG